MTKLIICGQAPSRVGDGRPFSGPSGSRLARLFGLEDYEALASQFALANIFPVSAVKLRNRKHAGDAFDRITARRIGTLKVRLWGKDPEHIVVLACGTEVMRALTGQAPGAYHGKALSTGPAQGLDIWQFPHPSGANHYWNDPEQVERAREFVGRLLKHYGIAITK